MKKTGKVHEVMRGSRVDFGQLAMVSAGGSSRVILSRVKAKRKRKERIS